MFLINLVVQPSIDRICTLVRLFCAELLSSSLNHDDFRAKNADLVLNLVERLLKFNWTDRDSTKKGIENILESALTLLSLRIIDHSKIQEKISKKFDELEKPWIIKSNSHLKH